MEAHIAGRFTDAMLGEIAAHFGASRGECTSLDGFENFIFKCRNGEGEFILRVGHSARRPRTLVEAEIEWLVHLAALGVQVAEPIHTQHGDQVAALDDGHGEQFIGSGYQVARGGPVRPQMLSEAFYEEYGYQLGRMHAAARDYTPKAGRRPEWDDKILTDMATWLPQGEEDVGRRYEELRARLNALPKDEGVYGLIHQDAHFGNLFVDERGKITFFDFDDCCRSWYINDIAIVFFYLGSMDWAAPEKPAAQAAAAFLRGCQRAHPFDPAWLAHIPDFLKLRELELYGVVHRDFDVEAIEHPWVAGFMQGRRERILDGVPVMELDFERLGK